jgi:transmembrane sensor
MILEAARWLAIVNDESVSPDERSAFERWCVRDVRHRVAIERMRALWGSLDQLPAVPARIALNRAFTRPRSRLAARSVQTLALFGVLVCGWAGVDRLPIWLADEHTGAGERRDVQLADGSRVQLNSQSALDIRFDGHQRTVELLKGEMWVEVAKDAQRPFVVRTDQGTATALGTRYLVKRAEDGTTVVTVIESVVATQAGNSAVVKVKAGEKTTLTDGHVQPPQPVGDDDPTAWTRGVYKANDRPLTEVLNTLAGNRPGLLEFDEQALQGLRASGVFCLDDTDAALATLADNLPIKVQRFTDWLVVVKRR